MDEEQGQILKIFLKGFKDNLKSSDALAEEVRRLIDDAVAEAARIAGGVKAPLRFVFANNVSLRKRLEAIIARLRSDITCRIEQGSRDAWTRAEATNAAVISALAANNAALARAMSAGLTKKATDRALAGWLVRKTAGLGLSDRVWNLTSRLKTEMEQAIEIALAQGTPAAKLSQEVRHCLQNPDNYFRRFRYQKQIPLFERDGSPKIDPATGKQAVRKESARKWKRRYVDKEGKVRWQDVDLNDYRYGPGVYRSSYKNAMRLARTEVNMAYQASDHERWKASWWVKGIRIALSNNHPVKDICDILAGDYPPDFKFTGWHPQCRCSAVGLTMSHAEIIEYQRHEKAGEDMSRYEVPGKIKEPPRAFKEWVADNLHRFKDPSKLPYFLRDNAKYSGVKMTESVKSDARDRSSDANGNKIGLNEVKNPISDAVKNRRGEIRVIAKATIVDKPVGLPMIGKRAVISNKGVKEWINQPHKHLAAKNELILDIKNVLNNSKYLGFGPDKHDPSSAKVHIFETVINGDNSWIIIRELHDGQFKIYSISDNPEILRLALGNKEKP